MNTFWKATLVRALRTVCQTLASMLPVSAVVTPSLLQSLDWSFLFVIAAWIGTGLLSGVASVLTSIATGLPEVEYEKHLYQYHDEPADSEVTDDDNE
ncbi:MAG: holin [Clostridia bacterium]|nr:holin [Clostridia bacterium]